MKPQIKTLIDAIIHDNREILVDTGMTVKEWLINSLESVGEEAYWYLTDEEAEEYERNPNSRAIYLNQIYDLLNEYDYNLDKNYSEELN